jgi:hypothetical protein
MFHFVDRMFHFVDRMEQPIRYRDVPRGGRMRFRTWKWGFVSRPRADGGCCEGVGCRGGGRCGDGFGRGDFFGAMGIVVKVRRRIADVMVV